MHSDSGKSKGKRKFPWFKFFPKDYLEDTRNLTPEQRGIYTDCLCLMYQFDRPLPDDDKWMSHALHISPRLWRTIRDALVADGKLVKTAEGLINKRAEKERGSRSVRPRFKLGSRPSQARTKLENSELPNENNKTASLAHDRLQTTEEREEEREEKKASSSVAVLDAPRAAAADQSELFLQDIESWMHGGGRAAAEAWLARSCQHFGEIPLRDAWVKIKTDLAAGALIGKKLPTLVAIAKRYRDEQAKAASQPAKPSAPIIPFESARDRKNREFAEILFGPSGEFRPGASA